MRVRVSGATLVLLSLCGCATLDDTPDPARLPPHEREYTTGSNMPRRTQPQGPSDVTAISRESLERAGGAPVLTGTGSRAAP